MRAVRCAWLLLATLVAPACAQTPAAPDAPLGVVDTALIMADLRTLAADSMEGRGTGSAGIERARRYLVGRFEDVGLRSFEGSYELPFALRRDGEVVRAVNLVGYVQGEDAVGPVMVVTAHYDHLGNLDGEIFNGADDNASGVAALLALAQHLAEHPPRHTVVFAALDAEEVGLKGAEALVSDPPIPLERIALNLNFDMVGRNERGELYAAGAFHYPFLRPHLEAIAESAPLRLRLGHDSPTLPPGDDWTFLSDQGPFHREGIPFVYFGVEDHPDYHRPTDDAERIDPTFFADAVATLIAAADHFDDALEEIDQAR